MLRTIIRRTEDGKRNKTKGGILKEFRILSSVFRFPNSLDNIMFKNDIRIANNE